MPSADVFAFRPDQARRELRLARRQLEHAANCAADCRWQSGEPVPQSVADYWRRVALAAAQYHRENARRAIQRAWPAEWETARTAAIAAREYRDRSARRRAAA